ncbi:MAG: glycosyltransferase family 4 protein [Candidatus Jordarchaeum sp.]|uniref:glycosyltransferase family 4 protein n=1 Tax=Candidatus Jordarchaeum sp. TaxID=2823881 RepID=UPI0040493915
MDALNILAFNWRDVTNPKAGGAEVHIHQVLNRLVQWGHSATLFCGWYEGCKRREEIDGIEIIRAGNQFTVYLAAFRYYLLNLRKRPFDIVIDDINGVPFFTPLYVKKPRVAIIHHLVRDIFFKELSPLSAVIGYTTEQIIPLLYRETPFIAVSESTKQELIEFGILGKNIAVVYNGIDNNFYEPSRQVKSPYPHILYLGRLKKYKSIEHLIIAMKYVTKELPNVKLSIAGEGDAEYKNELKKLAEGWTNIRFHGFVNEKEKLDLMKRAWVFVTTSEREGWGLTVIEANACKTPAIVTDVLGLRDVVKNNETGFTIPYGQPKILANALIKILTDKELREKLSQKALEWSKQFNWNKTSRKILQIIKHIIDNQDQ